MYYHVLYHGQDLFWSYCLLAFSTDETLKRHVKDCFKKNGKKSIIIPKKSEYVTLENFERKIESPPIIYADF